MNRFPSDVEIINIQIIDIQGIAGKGKTMTMIAEYTNIFDLLLYIWNSDLSNIYMGPEELAGGGNEYQKQVYNKEVKLIKYIIRKFISYFMHKVVVTHIAQIWSRESEILSLVERWLKKKATTWMQHKMTLEPPG